LCRSRKRPEARKLNCPGREFGGKHGRAGNVSKKGKYFGFWPVNVAGGAILFLRTVSTQRWVMAKVAAGGPLRQSADAR